MRFAMAAMQLVTQLTVSSIGFGTHLSQPHSLNNMIIVSVPARTATVIMCTANDEVSFHKIALVLNLGEDQSQGVSHMDQFATFAYVVGFGGGACVLVSVMTGSIIPLAIGAVALFAILAFMNGLGEAPELAIAVSSKGRSKK